MGWLPGEKEGWRVEEAVLENSSSINSVMDTRDAVHPGISPDCRVTGIHAPHVPAAPKGQHENRSVAWTDGLPSPTPLLL